MADDNDKLNAILREYLRDFLDADLQRRMERPPGTRVYGHWWEPGDPGAAKDANLKPVRE